MCESPFTIPSLANGFDHTHAQACRFGARKIGELAGLESCTQRAVILVGRIIFHFDSDLKKGTETDRERKVYHTLTG